MDLILIQFSPLIPGHLVIPSPIDGRHYLKAVSNKKLNNILEYSPQSHQCLEDIVDKVLHGFSMCKTVIREVTFVNWE